ncbi:MAG TPA: endonuclease/exonuclease/phosphatase family protein [Pyrinomonadaceae bacterium]
MLPKINIIITHLHLAQTWNKKGVQPSVLLVLLTLLMFGGLTAGTVKAQRINANLASDVKVLTWNIHGGQTKGPGCKSVIPCQLRPENYLSHVLEEINRHEGLDAIALQEVYRSQARTLAQALARTRGFYDRPYFVETRSCGAPGVSDNDFGIAIISRTPFIDVERVKIDPPLVAGPERRMLARVIIQVQDRRVYVYNTHLATNSFQRMGEVDKIRAQVIKDRNNHGASTFRPILMGDLNAEPGTWTYNEIRRGLFLDAWREVHSNDCTTFSQGSENGCTLETFKPDQRADYILVGSGGVFRVDFAQVTSEQSLFDIFGLKKDGRTPNERTDCNKVPDHLPVVAHLSYRDK